MGASGDLAKKKTYPALYALTLDNHLSLDKTQIFGYARSDLSDAKLREKLRPYLEKTKHKLHDSKTLDSFLNACVYRKGGYGNAEDMANVVTEIEKREKAATKANRVYYFAIPPFVFVDVAAAIKSKLNRE